MGFLSFVLKCCDVLAWPLFALGYPLCASISAIESNSNSDTRKLVTYWVLFSLISLFEHALVNLLQWLTFWPYMKLMVVCWLTIPQFNGALYVYEHLVRPCLSMEPQLIVNLFNELRELYLTRYKFPVEVDIHVKENGPEALEKLVSSKSKCIELNSGQKAIKAVEATDRKEVVSKCIELNAGQKEIKAVEATEKTEVVSKCIELTAGQKEIKAIEVTEKKEVAVSPIKPTLNQTENRTAVITNVKEMEPIVAPEPSLMAGGGFLLKLDCKETETIVATEPSFGFPQILDSMKVQKEWTCAICQVRTQSETTLDSHLKGKRHMAAYTQLKAIKNKSSPASTAKKHEHHNVKKRETIVIAGPSVTASGNFPDSKKVQKEWNCAICKVKTTSEITLLSHLRGNKHKATYEQLKAIKNPKKAVQITPGFCYICNCCMSSNDMDSHFKGKKHLARIQELAAFVV